MSHREKSNKLWVDQGKEFYSKDVKRLGFEIYSTNNESKAVVIERFNHTLKSMVFKLFTEKGSQNWLHLLPDVLRKYNNKVYSTIKTTPQKVSNNPQSIQCVMYDSNFENEMHLKQKNKRSLNIKLVTVLECLNGNLTLKKVAWQSGIEKYLVVNKVNNTAPVTYDLKDLEGEEIVGHFYEHALQHTDY